MLAHLSRRSVTPARLRLAASAVAMAMVAVPAVAQEEASWALVKSDADVAAATEAGVADAARDGGKVDAPTGKKIGLLLLSGQSPANQRVVSAAEGIADMFGFEVIVLDKPEAEHEREEAAHKPWNEHAPENPVRDSDDGFQLFRIFNRVVSEKVAVRHDPQHGSSPESQNHECFAPRVQEHRVIRTIRGRGVGISHDC